MSCRCADGDASAARTMHAFEEATGLPRWSQIDTVLLDMDGTLLDLRLDNYFWLELVPERYAELTAARAHGIGQVVAVSRPDSTQHSRAVAKFPAVESMEQLLRSLTSGREAT